MLVILAIWIGLGCLFLGLFAINNVEMDFSEPKQTKRYTFSYTGDGQILVVKNLKRDSKGRFSK
jgi:hypothetical protein